MNATSGQTHTMEEEVSKARKVLSFLSWSFLFLFLLILFTVIKMPQDRVHHYLMGTLNQQLSQMGMQIAADEGGIGFGSFLQYELKGIKLTKSATGKTLSLSEMTVSPALRGLVEGKLGADFKIEEGSGLVEGSFFSKGEDIDGNIHLQGINLGRLGALPFFAGMEGTAEIRGDIEFRGNSKSLSSMEGMTKLYLSRIRLDEQNFMGFKIPAVTISDGSINTIISSGKMNLSDVHLGKIGGSDDLQFVTNGSLKLGKYVYDTDLDLKMKLGLSKPLLSAFSIIDMILGPMKQPDGSYAFKLMGNINAVRPEIDPAP